MVYYYSIDLRKKVISYISPEVSKKEATIVFDICADTVYR
ncbi:MAG: IS630 transposase-related protein [Candidatus Lariskella arthropodorum]